MSFSSDLKQELCQAEPKETCCLKAECYGIWLFSKCFSPQETAFTTENGSVARRMAELAAACAGVTAQVRFAISRRKKQAYRVSLPDPSARQILLETFGHTGLEPSLRINRGNLEGDCCVSHFLRGAFLSCGSVTDPNKEYHLEFLAQHKNLAGDLFTLLGEQEAFAITPAVAVRKGVHLVYCKDSGQIEDLLTFLGAPGASMELMQIKMYKEALNNINRKTNFETANMDKTFSASARQTASIAVINDTIGLSALPEDLQELAALRLANPDMTLRQMSLQLHISRSGVNHRLRRILEVGEKLMSENSMPQLMGEESVSERKNSL